MCSKRGWLPPRQITKPRWLPELRTNKKTALEKKTADIALKNMEIKRRNKQNDGAAKKIIRDGNVRARELIKSLT
jgi:hypothetical protein